MKTQLTDRDLETLMMNYCQAEKDLKEALLKGYYWAEVKEKRELVTQLGVLIYKKRFPQHFPSLGKNLD